MFQNLVDKKDAIAVIGLGYVGLPIALAFARHLRVIGFDISEERIGMMRRGEDPSKELPTEAFKDCDIHFTAALEDLRAATFFVVAVPTPVDEHNVPDLRPVLAASRTIGQVIKKGDCVVYESTVYPGCTEEDCLPVVESGSGLKAGEDFSYGYSPERINPGDTKHTLEAVVKVVSGNTPASLDLIARVYETVVKAGVHRASSVKVAEAAKIIENTQRDLNIALMNELSVIFERMGINTYEVLEAAGTKWNFLKFYPGLVGGHCIGVDPYYLTYKSAQLGYNSRVILAGRVINDEMAAYVARKTVQAIIRAGTNPAAARVLVMGVTFKEAVSDIRNSKVADLVRELQAFGITVDATDPHASSDELQHEYGFGLVDAPKGPYDAVVAAVSHPEWARLDAAYFQNLLKPEGLLVDIKGTYRTEVEGLKYWSL